MASAGQCGFIRRNELLLVNYVGKFAGLKPDAPSIAVFPHGDIGVHRVGQPLAWSPISVRATTQTSPSGCPTNQSTSPGKDVSFIERDHPAETLGFTNAGRTG